ncbi:hypothetical protein RRG08_004072 [Elysia crispata]|uniref:G-protein coupled receptors family 2 profile 1 domain-containing protein n=1 Tax=Elysia crispata TaxID=231223 RepID=A0AAE0YR10_9GAST|nr:hypothetical protein RRG08_004072 [Elysia crispata]
MAKNSWILLFGFTSIIQLTHAFKDGLCRTKFGEYSPASFNIHACGHCYGFITRSEDIIMHPLFQQLVVLGNQSVFPQYTLLTPNDENITMANRICQTVSRDTCSRWKSCCRDARACCRRQLHSPAGKNGSCPRTWDGWGCWDDTPPEATVYIGCPSFLEHSMSSRYAIKHCNADGRWFMLENQTRENEWTDYTKCLDKDSLLVSIYLGLACNIASIVLLVPAIAIFIVYRSLRRQHRIRLHINFFGALLFADVINILWEMLVSHDQLQSSRNFDLGFFRGLAYLLAIMQKYRTNSAEEQKYVVCQGLT